MERALIMHKSWLSLIFDGFKDWEMRSANTNVRGEIGLIEKGSGLVLGKANLVDSFAVPRRDYFKHTNRHRITRRDDIAHKYSWAWQLANVERFEKPIPYDHPQGAVIWVKLKAKSEDE